MKKIKLWTVTGLSALGLLAEGLTAKADPQSYSIVAVTNIIAPLLDESAATANTDTNVNASYAIVQNADAFLTAGVNILGTNNPAGKLVLAHNFEAGDGNYTTSLPLTNSFQLTASAMGTLGGGGTNSTGVFQAWLSDTNFTGLKHGRVDTVFVTGATNTTVLFITIGWKTVSPY